MLDIELEIVRLIRRAGYSVRMNRYIDKIPIGTNVSLVPTTTTVIGYNWRVAKGDVWVANLTFADNLVMVIGDTFDLEEPDSLGRILARLAHLVAEPYID